MVPEIDMAAQTSHVENAEENKRPVGIVPVSAQASSHIRRKLDRHLMPVILPLYVLSYLDRGNIGNAKTAGAQKDLNLSSEQWTWVLNAFYISYVLFEWSTLLWKIFPAHIYVGILSFSWGTTAVCSGAVQSMAGLIACRVILGVAEASFGSGAPLFLSIFYDRNELALRIAFLLGMSPLANCFAGALAYGITRIQGSLDPWRWLFIIEGLPTVVYTIVIFFFLPDSPGSARFLTEQERTLAVERLQTLETDPKQHINWKHFFAGILDYRNLCHTFIHFMCNYSFAGLSNFLPTILEGMGHSSINAQGLTAPVYLASFILCVTVAFLSDKYGGRGLFIAVFSMMGASGYAILASIKDETKSDIRYLGVWLAVCGVFPCLCLNITWLSNNNSSTSKRGAGLTILATFGQCSSFASSALFPESDSPNYVRGCAVGCAFTGCISVLSIALYFRLRKINHGKDLLHGVVDSNVQYDITEFGDDHPAFRYVL